jgi:hypothetical protein
MLCYTYVVCHNNSDEQTRATNTKKIPKSIILQAETRRINLRT